MALKTWVFTKADDITYFAPQIACDIPKTDGSMSSYDNCDDADYRQKQEDIERRNRDTQKQRDAAQAVAMIIVAAPVFLYHWKLARKEA